MVARDEGRVGRAHHRPTLRWFSTLFRKPMAPLRGPVHQRPADLQTTHAHRVSPSEPGHRVARFCRRASVLRWGWGARNRRTIGGRAPATRPNDRATAERRRHATPMPNASSIMARALCASSPARFHSTALVPSALEANSAIRYAMRSTMLREAVIYPNGNG